MLFHREIPDKTGVCAVLQQSRLLGNRGLKPEPHPNTLSTTTDISRRERRFLPGPKAEVSTPRMR
jgi:ribosomal protein L1